jgi:hypothetical protein
MYDEPNPILYYGYLFHMIPCSSTGPSVPVSLTGCSTIPSNFHEAIKQKLLKIGGIAESRRHRLEFVLLVLRIEGLSIRDDSVVCCVAKFRGGNRGCWIGCRGSLIECRLLRYCVWERKAGAFKQTCGV